MQKVFVCTQQEPPASPGLSNGNGENLDPRAGARDGTIGRAVFVEQLRNAVPPITSCTLVSYKLDVETTMNSRVGDTYLAIHQYWNCTEAPLN